MPDLRWFDASAPHWLIPAPHRSGKFTLRLWNLWRRYSREGHWWGFGILQIGRRHLFYLGRTPGYPEREVWAWGLLFLGSQR